MNTPTKPVEQKARELLAAELERRGLKVAAAEVRVPGHPVGFASATLMAEAALKVIIAALNTDEERIRREAFEPIIATVERRRDLSDAATVEVHMADLRRAVAALSTPSKEVGR